MGIPANGEPTPMRVPSHDGDRSVHNQHPPHPAVVLLHPGHWQIQKRHQAEVPHAIQDESDIRARHKLECQDQCE